MKHIKYFVVGALIVGLAFAFIYWTVFTEIGFFVFLILILLPVAYFIGEAIIENVW